MFSQGEEVNEFDLRYNEKFQVVLPGEKRYKDVCFQHRFSIAAWFKNFHWRTINLSYLKGKTHVFPLFSPYKTLINAMHKSCRSNYVISSLFFSFCSSNCPCVLPGRGNFNSTILSWFLREVAKNDRFYCLQGPIRSGKNLAFPCTFPDIFINLLSELTYVTCMPCQLSNEILK